jgi:hypothetical protein
MLVTDSLAVTYRGLIKNFALPSNSSKTWEEKFSRYINNTTK